MDIIFIYKKRQKTIKLDKFEDVKMKEIYEKFSKIEKIDINDLLFFYEDTQINDDNLLIKQIKRDDLKRNKIEIKY